MRTRPAPFGTWGFNHQLHFRIATGQQRGFLSPYGYSAVKVTILLLMRKFGSNSSNFSMQYEGFIKLDRYTTIDGDLIQIHSSGRFLFNFLYPQTLLLFTNTKSAIIFIRYFSHFPTGRFCKKISKNSQPLSAPSDSKNSPVIEACANNSVFKSFRKESQLFLWIDKKYEITP